MRIHCSSCSSPIIPARAARTDFEARRVRRHAWHFHPRTLLLLLLLSLPSLPSLLLLLLLLSLLPKPLERLRYYARQMPLQRAGGASVPSEVRAATAQLRVAVLSWMAVNLPRAREEPTISVADERLDAALLQGWSTDGGRRAAVRALGPTPNCKLRAA
jgi:hypothetical protein